MKRIVIGVLLICSLAFLYSQSHMIQKKAAMLTLDSAVLDFTPGQVMDTMTEINEQDMPSIPPANNETRAARTASVSGNWSNTATWGGQSVPGSGDTVTINSGITVNVDVAAACTSITFAAVNANSTITINGTNTLTVSGLVSMPRPATGTLCTINVNAGSMTCGSMTMSATTSGRNDVVNITTGTMTVSGTLTSGTTGCRFVFSSTGTLNLNGSRTSSPAIVAVSGSTVNIGSGTLTAAQFTAMTLPSGSNLNYSGSAAQTVYATTYNCNLGFTGSGTKTIAASATVTANGNLNNSSTLSMTAGTSTTSTWLVMGGNVTNTGTINATASYLRFIFNSTNAQTLTNNGTFTAPVTSFDVSNTNASGLTISGSNSIVCTRVNLFSGTVVNSNKITLGNGGTTYATVQRGVASATNPAGTFDVSPTFNIGSGGYTLLYDNGSVAYSTSYEVPSTNSVSALYVFDAVDLTLNSDLEVTSELNFYGGTGTPILRIGSHTLTLGGTIVYTVAGSFVGGTSSNLVMNGSTTLNTITNGLNNLTIGASVTLGGAITVNNTLSLNQGLLNNGAYLTMASGSTISRSAGSLYAAPTFSGTVNLLYTGSSPITAGKELPTGSSVLNDLTTNSGGFIQYAYSYGSATNLLTEPFPSLSGWTGDIGTGDGLFNSNASVNAGGTTPEVRFTGSVTSPYPTSNKTFYICKTTAVNTTGYSSLNISFRTMSTGSYTQSVPTYMKLQCATSTSGPWSDVWSVGYSELTARTVSIPNYSTNVGGNLYFQFAFVGDFYCLDYWYFDDLVVDGVPVFPVESSTTVNGALTLNGSYTIGGGNTLTINGTIPTVTGGIIGSSTSNLIITGTTALPLPAITSGINNFTLNRSGGATLGGNLAVHGALTFTSGSLSLSGNNLSLVGKDFSISGANSLSALAVTQTTASQTIESGNTIAHTWNIDGAASGPLALHLSWPTANDNGEDFTLGGAIYRYSDSAWSYIASSEVSTNEGVRSVSYTYSLSAKADKDVTVKAHKLPTVTTQAVTDVATTTATGNGNITSKGIPASVTQHGVCWSTSANPTLANSFTQEGSGSLGAFISYITSLNSATLYYVRAYATNKAGTAYGDQVSFTTNTIYDYPQDVPVVVGDNTILVTNGNANNAEGEIPATPNENFTPTTSYIFDMIGSGPWTITITTESLFGAYYLSGNWTVVPNVDGDIVFENITAPEIKGLELPVVLGDADPTLPVELSSFTVALNSQNYVNILWVTQTETNLTGFYVYRSTVADVTSALLISNIISPTNTSQQQHYIYTDRTLEEPGDYYYWLQVAEMDGSSEFHGPITINYSNFSNPGTPAIPLVTQLNPVYPNPFNPNAKISYGIAGTANVNIVIYNSRGQIVRTFNEGVKSANNYTISWNGKDNNGKSCATGVYYIKMQADKDSFTRKAVLMK